MKFITRLNPAVKMFILVIYALALLGLAIFIINLQGLDETEGYGTKPLDENIQVVAKLFESRTAASLTSENARERANWTIYFQVTKHNTNVEVSNIEMYVKAKTQDDTLIYFEESAKNNSSTYKGTPNESSLSFLSKSSGINKTATYSSSSKDYSKTNNELKQVFVRVNYKVVNENNESKNQILKFYFVPTKPEQENFTKYTNTISLGGTEQTLNLEGMNDYYALTVKPTFAENKTTTEKTTNDRIDVSLRANEQKINEQNHKVINSSLTVFAKVKNDQTDKDNYFSDYITVVDLHGVFVDKSSNAWESAKKETMSRFYNSGCSINTLYEVSELFVLATITYEDGTTQFSRTKIVLK